MGCPGSRTWAALTRCQRRLFTLIVILSFAYFILHRHHPDLHKKLKSHANSFLIQKELDLWSENNEFDIAAFQAKETILFAEDDELEPADKAVVSVDFEQSEESVENKVPEVDLLENPKNMDQLIPDAGFVGIAGQWRSTTNFTAKQLEIKKEFLYAWRAYKKSAWGKDMLKPLSKSHENWFNMGLTLIDSLDVLIIMNAKNEIKQSREWIQNELSFDQDNDAINLFECTIRVVGGLISAYTLTSDPLYSDKALDIADRLLPAWSQSQSAIPLSDVNPYRRKARPPKFTQFSSLSEVSTVQLEFRELAVIADDFKFSNPAVKTSKHLSRLVQNSKLVRMFISPHTGRFQEKDVFTLGARVDSFYEYLLKQWVQSNGDEKDDYLLEDYLGSVEEIRDKMVAVTTGEKKLTYIAELQDNKEKTKIGKMDHLVCFLPGTLALGYWFSKQIHVGKSVVPEWHLELAEEIAFTCHAMYEINSCGLAPEITQFDQKGREIFVKPLDNFSILRPEAVESWFYLYKITGEQKYRDWGWEFFESLKKNAKLPDDGGYASQENLAGKLKTRDRMESFFLGETMKYLFLLFSDDEQLLPLDKYVFNTEAHLSLIRTANNDKLFGSH